MQARSFIATLGLVLALAATGAPPGEAAEDGPALVSLGVGYYDINKQDDDAVDFRLEYRHGQGLGLVKPWIGAEGTSDGAVYGIAGLLADIDLGESIVLTPSFGVGAYSDGDGKDLGHTVEFRSQIELAYRFANESRLGLAFSHISNAGIGDGNPGAEILNIYYSIPLTGLLGD